MPRELRAHAKGLVDVGGPVREWFKRSHALRMAVRHIRLRRERPDVSTLGLPPASEGGAPLVLMASGSGSFLDGMTMDSLVATALQERGAEVHGLLCDEALPACQECTVGRTGGARRMAEYGPRGGLCNGCFATGASTYAAIGVPVHRYAELVDDGRRAAAARFAATADIRHPELLRFQDAAVGEHALAGTLRYFGRATLDGEPQAELILRRFLEAAALAACALDELFDRIGFDAVVVNHGVYVPQGVVTDVARRRGIRVVTWAAAYRRQTFVYSHGDSYHHTMLSEPTTAWEHMAWGPPQRERILSYLRSRWTGANDWLHFTGEPTFDTTEIERMTGVDFNRPVIGMLTNVMWDAQVIYTQNAFPNMLTWAIDTIRWFARHPELQLLIRVHPAEIKGYIPSRQPILDELRQVFGDELPANVFVIPPESNASTYAAMMQCDTVLIYATKTGVELAPFGIPVIVAGEAWVRNKGITSDASTAADYVHLLETLPTGLRLDDERRGRAERYAFHYFFRRMIPLEVVRPVRSAERRATIKGVSRADLQPGRSVGLDVICNGILHGTPFDYPAEAEVANALDLDTSSGWQ